MGKVSMCTHLSEEPRHCRSIQLLHEMLEGLQCDTPAFAIRVQVCQILFNERAQVPRARLLLSHLRVRKLPLLLLLLEKVKSNRAAGPQTA